MIPKPLDDIIKTDIDALIDNQVCEGKNLEYKQELPKNSDNGKKEFLADISSFANAAGGDIIYGIQEQRDNNNKTTGLPAINGHGLGDINPDKEILRLNDIIREGIKPRINGVEIAPVNGLDLGPALIIRIPKSWAAPHMVTFKNSSRFYSRTSTGKYQLDVDEIRSAFLLSESLSERITNFRNERIAKIIADETPVSLKPGVKIVLHFLPFVSFDRTTQIDIRSIGKQTKPEPIIDSNLMYYCSWGDRYNFDGHVRYVKHERNYTCLCYLQIFRSGEIESVCIYEHDDKVIDDVFYEKTIISGVQRYLEAAKNWGVSPPFLVLLSLLNVKGYRMPTRNRFSSYRFPEIDRDVLILPDILVQEYDVEVSKLLRPAFDALWQAAGWDGSRHYDENGNWVNRR